MRAATEIEVLNPHQLGDSGGHLGSDPRAMRREHLACCVRAQQPVAKIPNSQMPDGSECGLIMTIEDEPGDLIGFVRDQ